MQIRQLVPSSDLSHSANSPIQHSVGSATEPIVGNPALSDKEQFIRSAFAENPQKGCELLFRRYHQALCSHAVRYVYSKETAEDLVSEVFCKFWKTKAYQSVTSSYRYYLFRSVRNEAYNYLRLEFQQHDDIDTAEGRDTGSHQRPDQVLQYEEVLHRVEELVESLPPQCRRVFLLSRFEGKKYQDIAIEMGISVKTVETHMVKALNTVRKGLKDHWLMILVALWRVVTFCDAQ